MRGLQVDCVRAGSVFIQRAALWLICKIFFRERYILKGEGPNQISWAGALGECFYMYPTSDEQSLEQNTDLYQF